MHPYNPTHATYMYCHARSCHRHRPIQAPGPVTNLVPARCQGEHCAAASPAARTKPELIAPRATRDSGPINIPHPSAPGPAEGQITLRRGSHPHQWTPSQPVSPVRHTDRCPSPTFYLAATYLHLRSLLPLREGLVSVLFIYHSFNSLFRAPAHLVQQTV